MNRQFWRGKRVFITGHTGFKGGWLALWLAEMGAEVHGYALPPPTEPSLFEITRLEKRLASNTIDDIRSLSGLMNALRGAQPEIVFHLAAQPLVRLSYAAPVETYAVNVMGTVNLLESVRQCASVKTVINITTDKCYENREWMWPYRENEALGGYDAYSSSKACSELVTAAYRQSFLDPSGIHVATARAGNVIGGGDWATDRLVPDFLRALDAGKVLILRSPKAVRPWQHVLDPLYGYLVLAERLFSEGRDYAGAWNFGPEQADAKSVQWIAEYLCSQTSGANWRHDVAQHPHEAGVLKLDSTKARELLGWRPHWDLETSLRMTLAWHSAWKAGDEMAAASIGQIHEYEASAGRHG